MIISVILNVSGPYMMLLENRTRIWEIQRNDKIFDLPLNHELNIIRIFLKLKGILVHQFRVIKSYGSPNNFYSRSN